jgi:hypothetical protein
MTSVTTPPASPARFTMSNYRWTKPAIIDWLVIWENLWTKDLISWEWKNYDQYVRNGTGTIYTVYHDQNNLDSAIPLPSLDQILQLTDFIGVVGSEPDETLDALHIQLLDWLRGHAEISCQT